MKPSIPFSPPHIDKKILDSVTATLKSGWITNGPKTAQFENLITEFCGNKKTLCVNSATAGMELILEWFGVGEGDEVIVPAYTYAATANVVIQRGAKVVFADIGNDFTIDAMFLEKLITAKTKVIIPVDFGGFPCDYDPINSLVQSKKIRSKFKPANPIQKKLGRILVMSDAAHSFGSSYKGKKCGTFSDVTVFSFHAVKNLSTGEGGAIAFNLPQKFNHNLLYNELHAWCRHGRVAEANNNLIQSWKYDVIYPGRNILMNDILASMGIAQIESYIMEVVNRRKEIFKKYSTEFSKQPWAIVPEFHTNERETSYHLFALRINGATETLRNKIIRKINDLGVAVNVHFVPLPMFTYYKKIGYDMKNYPVSYNQYMNVITLPVYYDLSDANVKKVIASVNKVVNDVMG